MLADITKVFVSVRFVQYLLIYLSPNTQFDTSTELLLKELGVSNDSLNEFWNINLWNKLLSWDSVFFLKRIVSQQGTTIQYEHERAFSIIWCELIRYFTSYSIDLYYSLKIAVVIENLLFYISTIVLYYLTVITFNNNNVSSNNLSHKIARKTSLLFIISGFSGYVTGIYSEPLSFCLTFIGMFARQYSISIITSNDMDINWCKWPLYSIVSTMCFTLATVNRSNCILLGLFYIFDLIKLVSVKKYQRAIFFPLLSGLIMLTHLLYYYYYIPFNTYCPERGEWCQTQIIKSLPFTKISFYNFIQLHYWNVGFLKYWTLNNIPNFLFAIPNIIVLSYSTIYFTKIYPLVNLTPLVWITRTLVILLLFFAHTQIINRVSSFIPLHLWYLADRLVKNTIIKKDDNEELKGDDKIVKIYIYWLIIWIPLQTILFACFLPPA
ncbi:hypothetical protein Kpol_1045p62 [Vanderwaltozyma polyspora DSM 70294]|uniref:GPI mannosyltransferase 2 n=1 Tax=Vanderwaltozyma polyspora (strain ATCC 22028 / DSM 70294 / BCRC 21397 / CBS 2163 / NBRC 10782 / NRRL Y-8283 / UCD 57-17) TaxID=436907 RepID=A7TI68_VANPO|nr:uncharacterized protein Kpol_1045p62 [Vanderwaltozyma polyspora DSM 70294]EDO18075.1 hypothetical protein Kpol_1045p62 [Vanderwaltozyma polyspora DSM 70294]